MPMLISVNKKVISNYVSFSWIHAFYMESGNILGRD